MTTHIESLTHTVTEMTPDLAQAIGLAGQIVTHNRQQWTVHSIEGHDWYVHVRDGIVVVDRGLTPSFFIREPWVSIIPSGHVMGDGRSTMVGVSEVKRGVCLQKPW